MTSEEAAACLGVKRATLYSYVTRGLVRTVAAERRQKRYVAADIWALKRRAAAARGHAAAAAIALDWGAPVLSTAISSVDRDGPLYRGRSAWILAERDTPFEAVARGLWGSDPDDARPFVSQTPADVARALAAVPPTDEGAAMLRVLSLGGPALDDPQTVLDQLVGALAFVSPRKGVDCPGGSVAERLTSIYGLSSADVALINRSLVLCADHELNASTFAARVAASTGVALAPALLAALGTFLGPRHGQAPLVVASLVAEAAPDVTSGVARQIAEGRLDGYGHPLYPDGDPRAVALLDWVTDRAPASPDLDATLAHIAAVRDANGPPPTLDVGLVALEQAVGAPSGFAVTVFAIGRAAGWVAHVLEQRATPGILRPRARYVGP